MSATPSSHFAGLDPLRFAAALVVLGFHAIETGDWSGGLWSNGGWGLLRAGWAGVDVFFVISGLVIGSSAMRGAECSGAWRSDYWRRRLARIVPLYLVTCAVFLLAINADPVTGPDAVKQVVTHLLFVHNVFPSTLSTINPPSWSLANEMQFYLLAMLAAGWLLRRRPWSLAIAALLFALLFRVLVWRIARAGGIQDVGILNWLVTLAPAMLDSFGLGVALAVARRHGVAPPSGARRWLCAAVGVAMLAAPAGYTEPMVRGLLWQQPVIALGLHTWAAIGAALLVWAVHDLRPTPRSAPAWRWAGQLSYGIYLWHTIVLLLLLEHTAWRGATLLFAVVPPTLLLAWLGWQLVEQPMLRRFARGTQAIGKSSVNTVWPVRER